jgi:hypothetical protein
VSMARSCAARCAKQAGSPFSMTGWKPILHYSLLCVFLCVLCASAFHFLTSIAPPAIFPWFGWRRRGSGRFRSGRGRGGHGADPVPPAVGFAREKLPDADPIEICPPGHPTTLRQTPVQTTAAKGGMFSRARVTLSGWGEQVENQRQRVTTPAARQHTQPRSPPPDSPFGFMDFHHRTERQAPAQRSRRGASPRAMAEFRLVDSAAGNR